MGEEWQGLDTTSSLLSRHLFGLIVNAILEPGRGFADTAAHNLVVLFERNEGAVEIGVKAGRFGPRLDAALQHAARSNGGMI